MTVSRVLFLVAVLLFLVALVLVVWAHPTAKVVDGFALGGLASLAGGHAFT